MDRIIFAGVWVIFVLIFVGDVMNAVIEGWEEDPSDVFKVRSLLLLCAKGTVLGQSLL